MGKEGQVHCNASEELEGNKHKEKHGAMDANIYSGREAAERYSLMSSGVSMWACLLCILKWWRGSH